MFSMSIAAGGDEVNGRDEGERFLNQEDLRGDIQFDDGSNDYSEYLFCLFCFLLFCMYLLIRFLIFCEFFFLQKSVWIFCLIVAYGIMRYYNIFIDLLLYWNGLFLLILFIYWGLEFWGEINMLLISTNSTQYWFEFAVD